jgi:hypothetical protein
MNKKNKGTIRVQNELLFVRIPCDIGRSLKLAMHKHMLIQCLLLLDGEVHGMIVTWSFQGSKDKSCDFSLQT